MIRRKSYEVPNYSPISPICPTSSAHPAPKKTKLDSPEIEYFDDYSSMAIDYDSRKNAIAGSNIDIYEMYAALCESATPIPVPHTLLEDESEKSSDSETTKRTSSIEDRKQVILKLISRRSSMKISNETLHLSVAILDKSLDLMEVDNESIGALAAITLIIASKIEDVVCLTMESALEFITEKVPSVGIAANLERFVLVTLDFKVTMPTPFNFASYMLVHLCAPESTMHSVYYFLELSLLYVYNRSYSSDVVAYAATCLAFAMETDPGKSVMKTLRETELKLRVFSDKNHQKKRSESREVMRIMSDLFLVAASENHSIYREYATSRRFYVANRRIDPDLQEMLQIDSD
ncbi:hypothetical protein CRE_13477 [Caenorhabditis remanei]|uniref:Cyclin C-terminal domain-containing protein n=1 Tax=Caenorhabditis remanei TaxID=31234 RepID=E3MR74_CAERE|nr:hypothetical protein CRE_13477 [Caenorhabditis remanei]